MKHRRGASSWAYCVVAVLIASTATPLAASANNASCSSSDVDLCPISQPVMEALEVKRTEGKIYMHVFYPGKNALTDDEYTVKIAAELARNHINRMPSILPGYELELVFSKTQASPSEATWRLVQATTEPQYANITWAMFIGGSSSDATMPLAAIANHYYNLTMISFGATSPELTDSNKYPMLYRTIPSEELSNELRLAFMQEYNWTRIAILYRSEPIFQKSETYFRNLYEERIQNETGIPTRSFADDPEPAFDALLGGSESNRIIFAWVNEMAATVLSMAYRKNRIGPKYVWILPGWLNDEWWKGVNCSGCDWKHVLSQNVFLVDSYMEAREQERNMSTPTNKTTLQFDEEFEDCRSRVCPSEAVDWRRYFMYDAVLAGAIALNDTQQQLADNNMTFNDLSYDNSIFINATGESMSRVDFQGVSGRVTFVNRARNGILALYQYVLENDTIVKRLIALYDNSEGKLEFLPGRGPQWAGNRTEPPPDSSRRDVIYLLQPQYAPVVYTFTAITAAAIVLDIGLFLFNLFTARMKLLASTGPLLNGIIIAGCILVLLTTYTVAWIPPVVTDENNASKKITFEVFCNVRLWLFTVGFSLSFGALFAKIWQAYRVYTKPELKQKKLQYWNFFLVLGVLITLDIIFLCIWTFIEPWRLRHKFLYYPTTPDDVIYKQDNCDCEHRVFFEGTLLVIKALFIIFGFFLAYESRNVQYEHLTDSRYTSYAMFVVVTVLFVFGIPAGVLYFVPPIFNAYIWSYVFMNLVVILSTTGGLLTLFIPRFIALAQGKDTLLPPQQQGDEVDVDEMEIGKVDPSVTMEDMHTSMISSATAELGTFGTAELGSFGTAETSLSEAAKPTEAENGSSASSDSGNVADSDSRRPSIQTSTSGMVNGSAVPK